MQPSAIDEWRARPKAAARWVTIAYCVIVLLPLGAMVIGGAFWLMSFEPIHPFFVLAALFCALLGPAMVLLVVPAIQAVSNQRLVLDDSDFFVLNAQRKRTRSIARSGISGVWTAELPARRAASDVPTFPRRVYVIAGGKGDRPVLLTKEYAAKDLTALWQRLGRTPTDIGRLSENELEERFPGSKETIKDLIVDLGIWGKVYVVAVVAIIVICAIRLAL